MVFVEHMFGRLEQKDLQALVDYSKEAWINGKKAMYIMSDGSMHPSSYRKRK